MQKPKEHARFNYSQYSQKNSEFPWIKTPILASWVKEMKGKCGRNMREAETSESLFEN